MKILLDNFSAGIIKDRKDYEIPLNAFSDGNNVVFRDNVPQKIMGHDQVYSTLGCRPAALFDYADPATGNSYWIYPGYDDSDNGVAYSVQGANHTNITRTTTVGIDSTSVANPTVVTTSAAHNITNGDTVTIAGVTGGTYTPTINGTFTATVTGATTFTVEVNCAVEGTLTSATATGDDFYAPSKTIPWTSCTLGGLFVLNNGVDAPQMWSRTSGTLKANLEILGNWPTDGSASPYKCRVIDAFRGFLVAMDITIDDQNPTRNPYRIMWSNAQSTTYSAPSTWTAAANNLAGDAYLTSGDDYIIGGHEQRGNYIIYKERSVYIMRYIGGSAVMAIDLLFNDRGLIGPNAVTEYKDGIHFVVGKGEIYIHDGTTAQSIADDIVKNEIFDAMDGTYYMMTYCVTYTAQEEVWLCYPTNNSYFANKAAIWNYETGAWSFRDLQNAPFISSGFVDVTNDVETVWDTNTKNWDTETKVWTALDASKASDALLMINRGADDEAAGDTVAAAKFQLLDSSNKFDGSDMTSYLRKTGIDVIEGGDAPGNLKFLRQLYPKIYASGPIKIRTGAAMNHQANVAWTEYQTFDPESGDYKVDCRNTGRYLAFEVFSDGNVTWRIDGLEMDYEVVSGGR